MRILVKTLNPNVTPPMAMVQYMCRESLRSYLCHAMRPSDPEKIAPWVMFGESNKLGRRLGSAYNELVNARILIIGDSRHCSFKKCLEAEITRLTEYSDDEYMPKVDVLTLEDLINKTTQPFDYEYYNIVLANLMRNNEHIQPALRYINRVIKPLEHSIRNNGEAYVLANIDWTQTSNAQNLGGTIINNGLLKRLVTFNGCFSSHVLDHAMFLTLTPGNDEAEYGEMRRRFGKDEYFIQAMHNREYAASGTLTLFDLCHSGYWRLVDDKTRALLLSVSQGFTTLGDYVTIKAVPSFGDLCLSIGENKEFVVEQFFGTEEEAQKAFYQFKIYLGLHGEQPATRQVVSSILHSKFFLWYYYHQLPRICDVVTGVRDERVSAFPFRTELSAEEQEVITTLYTLSAFDPIDSHQTIYDYVNDTAETFRDILDMAVYELYFQLEMMRDDITIIKHLYSYIQSHDKTSRTFSGDLYDWYLMPGNPVRDNMSLMEVRSRDFLMQIQNFRP